MEKKFDILEKLYEQNLRCDDEILINIKRKLQIERKIFQNVISSKDNSESKEKNFSNTFKSLNSSCSKMGLEPKYIHQIFELILEICEKEIEIKNK